MPCAGVNDLASVCQSAKSWHTDVGCGQRTGIATYRVTYRVLICTD